MRVLAFLVALLSFGQCASAVVVIGPHGDVPGQPFTSFVVMLAALAGLVLARVLWRGRPSAARGLPLWGAGMAAWGVALVLAIASPSERRLALPAVVAALPLWGGAIWLATRHVRRRVRGVV